MAAIVPLVHQADPHVQRSPETNAPRAASTVGTKHHRSALPTVPRARKQKTDRVPPAGHGGQVPSAGCHLPSQVGGQCWGSGDCRAVWALSCEDLSPLNLIVPGVTSAGPRPGCPALSLTSESEGTASCLAWLTDDANSMTTVLRGPVLSLPPAPATTGALSQLLFQEPQVISGRARARARGQCAPTATCPPSAQPQ